MNKTKYTHLIYLAIVPALPCLVCWALFGQWFPYFLPGKQFLVFFLMYMLTGYGILVLSRVKGLFHRDRSQLAKILLCLTLLISVTRCTQGVYHHKPIGFLVMLSFIHVAILLGLFRRKGLERDSYKQI